MSEVKPDIKERIEKAAQALLERGEKATVDAVRRLAKSSMGDTLVVMRVWRLAHSLVPVPVATAVPETVTKAFGAVVVELWSEAQALADTGLAAAGQDWAIEKSRLRGETDEAVEAVDRQTADTTAVQARLTEAETAIAALAAQALQDSAESRLQITGLTETAHDATMREQVTRKTADEYKESMMASVATEAVTRAELATERRMRGEDLNKIDTLTAELAIAKAIADTRQRLLLEGNERLNRAEGDLAAALSSQAETREEAAQIRGRLEAQETQIESLMRALKNRDVDRSAA
jgi:colicin import membrane protein